MSIRLCGLALFFVLLGCFALPSLAQSCYAPSALNFTSEKGALWVNGNSFKLKGASWFGFETSNNVVHGLWAQSYTFFLDFLASNGFNAIRMPFYLGLAINDATPNSIDYSSNADLQGLSSLQVMDTIIEAAAARGLLIMLDLHSFSADSYASDGLWYNSNYPEATVISGWTKLLARYQNQWNVIAADLKNEPFSATWGTGNTATDWNLAAARMGNAIASSVSSRFLIFVEGTANSPSCSDACFYGEDVVGVSSHPVALSNPNKLVYSPHVYGPSVYGQSYFSAGNFPSNMPAIWDAHWGFVPAATGNAVVIGEWGGPYSGTDATWLAALSSYLLANDMTDQFFWCLNPDSGDTGGLLENDWATPDTQKLALLAGLVTSPTKFSVNSAGQVCLNGGTTAASPSATPASVKASPSSTPAAGNVSPTPAAHVSPSSSPAAAASPSSSPAAQTSSVPSGGVTFYAGSSAWWMAVTIPGSTSVQVNCGNGQGFVTMAAGWTSNLWTFSPTNGQACQSSVQFIVNGGAAQTVTAPW